jgi:lipopolysaccharide export system permease protein
MRLGVLTKYLIRVHLGPFLFSLTTITGLIFLNSVAQRMEGLLGKGLPPSVLGEFLLLSLPHTVALSLPMAVLVAVLYAFSELAASNEITALSSGGVRPFRVMLPVLALGAAATAAMLYFNDAVLPEANHRLRNLMVDIGRKSPTFQLREQVVNEIQTDNGRQTFFLTATHIDPSTSVMEDVTIFDPNNPVRQRTTHAERGVMAFNKSRTDLYLTLFDGTVREVQGDRKGGFQRVYFQKQVVPLRGVGDELDRRMGGSERSDREMDFAMLRERADERRQDALDLTESSRDRSVAAVRMALGRAAPNDAETLGSFRLRQPRTTGEAQDSLVPLLAHDGISQAVAADVRTHASRLEATEEAVNRYLVELYKKWAIAFACLVFTLIGPPLALRFPRGGVGLVVAGSTVIFAIYWVGLIGGESLADRRMGDPMITMWIPNLVFLAVGLLLVSRMGRAGGTARGGGGLTELFWRVRRALPGAGGGGMRGAEGAA